ncbi:hypothetical protein K9N68_13960 [Kovacikia minuta CCNUW1]|uniref:hypothetical protein n=1 Tax=Kovacikia minuta TaxID=2931930 RepID=UPI001CCD3A91|nr:hypothetical protein [Kovacikia minuta]UBF28845.1 hypothetical protein K9N68_13960 [Kovacikia minuta CCNUW1]
MNWRYEEAQKQLAEAISLNSKQPTKNKRWDANCVLAEVFDALKNKKAALKEAQTCIAKAAFYTTFDYRWGILARQRVEAAKNAKEISKILPVRERKVAENKTPPSTNQISASGSHYSDRQNPSYPRRSYIRQTPLPDSNGGSDRYPIPDNASSPLRGYYGGRYDNTKEGHRRDREREHRRRGSE